MGASVCARVQLSVCAVLSGCSRLDANVYTQRGLEPGRRYEFRIRGVNGGGMGEWSDVSWCRTMTLQHVAPMPKKVVEERQDAAIEGLLRRVKTTKPTLDEAAKEEADKARERMLARRKPASSGSRPTSPPAAAPADGVGGNTAPSTTSGASTVQGAPPSARAPRRVSVSSDTSTSSTESESEESASSTSEEFEFQDTVTRPSASRPPRIPRDCWYELRDPGTGHVFYLNTVTGAAQWSPPEWLSVPGIDRPTMFLNTVTAATATESPAGYLPIVGELDCPPMFRDPAHASKFVPPPA